MRACRLSTSGRCSRGSAVLGAGGMKSRSRIQRCVVSWSDTVRYISISPAVIMFTGRVGRMRGCVNLESGLQLFGRCALGLGHLMSRRQLP